MATEVRLPREGSTTMTSGLVLEWFVEVGDEVAEGQILAEIETDKVSIELAAPVAGTVLALYAAPRDEIDVGGLLAAIGDADETPPAKGTNTARASAEGASVEAAPTSPQRLATPGRIAAAPAARRRAAELDIDLKGIEGTGPGGRITSADVDAAASPTREPVGTGHLLRGLTGHRRLVAERMSQASREMAAVTLTTTADVTAFIDGSNRALVDQIAHNAVQVLLDHTSLNASLTTDGIAHHDHVDLGYAVDSPRGLVVPVIRDADTLGLDGLANERRRLVEAAQSGRLSPDDLAGGTFTITNLGPFGIEAFTPIITPGQTAILGVGTAMPGYAPRPDGPQMRQTLALSLTFDHRIVDGAPAARYLQTLVQALAGIE